MARVDIVQRHLDFLSGGIHAQGSLKDRVEQVLHTSPLDGLCLRVTVGKGSQRHVQPREQMAAEAPNVVRCGRRASLALVHVAPNAGQAGLWIREQRLLPFRIGPFDRRPVLIDDVVAASAGVRGIGAGKSSSAE